MKSKIEPTKEEIKAYQDMLNDINKPHPLAGFPYKAVQTAEGIRRDQSAGPDQEAHLMQLAANFGIEGHKLQFKFALYAMGYDEVE